jgi:DNA-binding CsgD family transcriptional regulator
VKGPALDRALEKIARLSSQAGDVAALWRGTTDVLADAVPFYWTPCFFTTDPASLLITSHYHEGLTDFPAEWLAAEYYTDDEHTLVDVVRSASDVSTLHDLTHGDPSKTKRWQRNMQVGGDQEMLARLRTRSGEVWGVLGLYREPGRPMFSMKERAFLAAASPILAEGARRALLFGEALEPEWPDAPGLLILTEKFEVESASPGVDAWLDELPAPRGSALPPAVLTVAAQAQRVPGGATTSGDVAVARVLSRGGAWIVLHGAPLVAGPERRVAVIVEPAHPARIFPLLMSAYGLTAREKEIVGLVLQGRSTSGIADTLVLSIHTVQQHIKNIFEKTGVRSRRDLVARVFFGHYEPRFRDNERRTAVNKPVRGGPSATATGTGRRPPIDR